MAELISRRSLIELGAGGASLLASTAAGAQTPSQPAGGRKLGFAVVGIGKLSQGQIIPGLRRCQNAKLTALVSGHPDKAQRVAAENGVPSDAIYSYEDFDRIAHDPRIDVVYIVLPNSMHAEYTIRAFKAGKHVLCEKPMATTIADSEAMIAAGKAAKRHLMIAYRCHYQPVSLEAMRRLRNQSMGKTRVVIADMGRQANPDDPSDAWRLDAKMSGGGALADMGIYGISAMRYLLNEEPTEVRAWAHTDPSDPRFKQTEELIAWQFKFPSGAIGNGSTSFSYLGTMAFRTFSDQGRLNADPGCIYNGNTLQVQTKGKPQMVDLPDPDQFAREMDWMANVVLGRSPMVSPGEEGLQDMRLMHAILESLRQGGAPVRTDFGYHRAVDPAAVVGITSQV